MRGTGGHRRAACLAWAVVYGVGGAELVEQAVRVVVTRSAAGRDIAESPRAVRRGTGPPDDGMTSRPPGGRGSRSPGRGSAPGTHPGMADIFRLSIYIKSGSNLIRNPDRAHIVSVP